ncbi:OmpA family protein [Leptospirillum ferriphilum]|jgi:peptidoglycan-associated lipoprotein|uniref:Peptidoglycan-associated outer membrane lipoprotein (OmpA/MotB) n=2 Tax=Leptospirillum TaxID=179 RepID=A0A094YNT7_9BACT|nr:OmpA family protein [Leptospirillum ferriphilum]EDZ39707.1 MAG: Putative outer membrane protein, OmpA/MotB family [Leptospirillum sp. Group II '5-way CG']KGA94911.1 peptidoglycan-associated outer membrane lipoprotein (OmpA/MotB precursor) [Leptospirillum ferriphilum]
MRFNKTLMGVSILFAGILVTGGCASTNGAGAGTQSNTTESAPAPAPAPAPEASNASSTQSDIESSLSRDITYGFDKSVLTSEDRRILKKDAAILNANPTVHVVIAGHADERGTDTYNIVLGQKRAKAAMMYLVNLGIKKNRIKIVSYGKRTIPGYDLCSDHNEQCWSKNRVAHLMKITM